MLEFPYCNNSSSRSDGLDELLNARILQHAATTSRPNSRAGSLSLHRRSSVRDHRAMKRKWRSTHGTTGEFALGFDIVHCDGGNFSSKKSSNVNILLKFCDPILEAMDSAFVLSKIIIKAPTHGFTAPCKEGLIFVSHEPISLEATSKYDDFTEADYQALLESNENGSIDDSWPAAYFRLDSITNMTTQVLHPNRSGKFISVKLLRAEGDADNIDLQYLGLIGFTGPRSFDAGSLR
ncbi:15650_t:CDS:2 [Funneliformis caledonium]|uniref:15650_t:CDS:1 n=1 Tax=Funneliformis caledonium TaxID=1117310 RepID=A0A9N9G5S8_9GLOM|nr:15650_t:CDS:2 [Funneliformis caledonium]